MEAEKQGTEFKMPKEFYVLFCIMFWQFFIRKDDVIGAASIENYVSQTKGSNCMKPEEVKLGMRVRYAPSPGRWFVGEVVVMPWKIGLTDGVGGTWVTKLTNMPADYATFTGKQGDKATTVFAAALARCEPADVIVGYKMTIDGCSGWCFMGVTPTEVAKSLKD